MNSVIEVENLVKSFGSVRPVRSHEDTQGVSASNGVRAVDGLYFAVEEGTITGLLGPNGAGKTTTIQMLLDLITPTSGTIRIFGKEYKTAR